jgi:glycosyltransferase involved in cell wall biosynthesis
MLKEQIKISIITPAYNEEKHIGECIESVLRQTWPHFEMVVVDDASSDSTAEIVKKYSAADKRVKLIRMQENSGVSTARNAALDNVHGDYLLFLDADDWILPEMLSDLVEMIHQYEMVDMFRLKGKKVHIRGEEPVPGDDFETQLYVPIDLVRENKMSGFMHNLFVKNRIVKDNQIRFTVGMAMLEDQEFTLKCMIYSERILYFTKQNYMYYQHPGSMSKNFGKDHYPDILNCAIEVYETARDELPEDEKWVYRDYAYQKAKQYLRRVLRNREVTASEIRSDMGGFLKKIDFGWNRNFILNMSMSGIVISKFFTAR